MATVSRLVLNHPALGATGGASLHASDEALYQKIGDAVDSRWFSLADFDQTETVDLTHNFNTDIASLRYDYYNFVGGEWVLITAATTPLRSAFSVIEKVGFENTVLQITNNTGGNNLTFAVVVVNDPISLANSDITDIDITTTAPEDGQALVYEASSSKFKPGASGDSSFKLQSVAANVATVKAGTIFLDDGKELFKAADTAFNLKTAVNSLGVTAPAASTAYYVYLDLAFLPAQTLVGTSDRKVYAVVSGTSGMFVVLATAPELTDLARYVPLYSLKTDGSSNYVTGNFANLAVRRHQLPAVNVSPLVYEDPDHSIGTVGSAGQLATYGALVAGDFPGAGSLSSFYGLNANGTDASANARTFSSSGSPGFNAVGFGSRMHLIERRPEGNEYPYSSGLQNRHGRFGNRNAGRATS